MQESGEIMSEQKKRPTVGLALGGGFYEGALLTTVLVLVAESFLSRLEYRILDHVPEINLYMEYTGKPCLEEVLRFLRENKVSLQDMEITRNSDSESRSGIVIPSEPCYTDPTAELAAE